MENACKSPILETGSTAVRLEVQRWAELPDWGTSRGNTKEKRQFGVMSTGCSDLSLGRKEWVGDSQALGVREHRQIKTSRSDLDVEKMHDTCGSHVVAACRDWLPLSLWSSWERGLEEALMSSALISNWPGPQVKREYRFSQMSRFTLEWFWELYRDEYLSAYFAGRVKIHVHGVA